MIQGQHKQKKAHLQTAGQTQVITAQASTHGCWRPAQGHPKTTAVYRVLKLAPEEQLSQKEKEEMVQRKYEILTSWMV